MITINLHKHMNGVVINSLDLSTFLDSKFFVHNQTDFRNMIAQSQRPYNISFTKSLSDKTIIIDFFSLYQLKQSIHCNHLIILDTADLNKHLSNIIPYNSFDTYSSINSILEKHQIDNVSFVISPYLEQKFTNQYSYNYITTFKKINHKLLKYISKPNQNILIRNQNGADNRLNLLDFKEYHYDRRLSGDFQEHHGRLIFEYLLLNRPVKFLNISPVNDGLNSYLIYSNASFDKYHYVHCNKSKLIINDQYISLFNSLIKIN